MGKSSISWMGTQIHLRKGGSSTNQRSKEPNGRGCEQLQNLQRCGTGAQKQIIMVFEPMYFDIVNDDMFGCANTSSKSISGHLFLFYDSIIAVDLEHNFENMRKAWDPQQPV
jgi:hypothetical protein